MKGGLVGEGKAWRNSLLLRTQLGGFQVSGLLTTRRRGDRRCVVDGHCWWLRISESKEPIVKISKVSHDKSLACSTGGFPLLVEFSVARSEAKSFFRHCSSRCGRKRGKLRFGGWRGNPA